MEAFAEMTDAEFVEVRRRYGDIVLEDPSIAQSLVDDLRRERASEEQL